MGLNTQVWGWLNVGKDEREVLEAVLNEFLNLLSNGRYHDMDVWMCSVISDSCASMDYSPSDSFVLGIVSFVQEHWSVLPFPMHMLVAQSVQIFVTPWTVACQAPLFMGFFRQEYWSGMTFPSPGNLPDPGIKARSPASQADSSPFELPGKPFPTLKSKILEFGRMIFLKI